MSRRYQTLMSQTHLRDVVRKNGIIWGKFGGGYMGGLRRLYGKIAEVMWEDCRGYMGRLHLTSAIFPYNLRRIFPT